MAGDHFTQLRDALGITDIQHTLAAIQRQLTFIAKTEGVLVSEVDDVVAAEQAETAAVAAETAEVDKLIADFEQAVANAGLTDAQKAALQGAIDAAKANAAALAAEESKVTAADPNAAPPSA